MINVSELPEPIFDPRFFFEMLICADVYSVNGRGGYLHILKITHEDIYECLPKDDEQICVQHGELLTKWCQGTPSVQPQKPTQPADALKTLKRELLGLTADVHGIRKGDPKEIIDMGLQKLNQHLMDSMLISDSEAVETLTEERLREVIGKLKG